jgi:hypothetical protein
MEPSAQLNSCTNNVFTVCKFCEESVYIITYRLQAYGTYSVYLISDFVLVVSKWIYGNLQTLCLFHPRPPRLPPRPPAPLPRHSVVTAEGELTLHTLLRIFMSLDSISHRVA